MQFDARRFCRTAVAQIWENHEKRPQKYGKSLMLQPGVAIDPVEMKIFRGAGSRDDMVIMSDAYNFIAVAAVQCVSLRQPGSPREL